jgi:hypothetical protein
VPPEEDHRVVDLSRYRRAAAERTRSRARPQPRASQPQRRSDGFLGANRHAKLILALMAAGGLALAAAPILLR